MNTPEGLKWSIYSLSLLTLARYMTMFLSKQPVFDFFGGWAFPIFSLFSTIYSFWPVMLALAIMLLFRGQSANVVPIAIGTVVLAFFFKFIEIAFNSWPSI